MAAHFYLPILAAIAVTAGLIMNGLSRPAVLSIARARRDAATRARHLERE